MGIHNNMISAFVFQLHKTDDCLALVFLFYITTGDEWGYAAGR